MRTPLKQFAVLSAALVAAAAPVMAFEVTRVEVASALVKCQKSATFDYYVSNMNGSVYTSLNPINRNGYALGGILLWRFDVSAYTGMVLLGDVDLTFGLTYSEVTPRLFHYYEGLSNWDESVVTWENWLGPTTTNANNRAFTNWFRAEITNGMVGNTALGTMYHVHIPSNLVLRWISDPLSNVGIGVIPDYYGPFSFATRSNTDVTKRPTLTMNFLSSNLKPLTPTNLTPVNAMNAQALSGIVLTASAFIDPNGNGHSNTQWQVSADPSFIALVWDSGPGPAGTAATIAVTLQYQTRYYWRVRYRDNDALAPEWSAWSAPTFFDTALNLLSAVTAREAKSCMIRPGVNADTNYSSVSAYNTVNPVTNLCPAGATMFFFDLRVFSMYTGMIVNSDGDLAIGVGWSDTSFPPTFNAREVLAPWDETNVTWNNFIGSDWTTWQNNFGASVLDAKVIDARYYTNHWLIPKALIQAWIDNPATNNGVAMIPQATGNCELRNRRAVPAPWLTFDLLSGGGTPPDTPTNVAPANGAVSQPLTPTLQSTAYSGPGVHGASQWQLATDPGFVGLVWDSGASISNLLSITVPSNTLAYSSRYYWHVRHISLSGDKSAYSPATSFDTEVRAGHFVKSASANAMIKYTVPISNWNSTVDMTFWPNGASNGVNSGLVLVQFDLDVFKNMTVGSDAVFSIQYGWVDPNFGAIGFTPYLLQAPWVETSVTWNTLVGVDNPNFWDRLNTNWVFGPSVALDGGTSTWTISQTIIQSWLDGSLTNNGFALVANQVNANCFMMTRRSPARGPKLEVDIVPEPATLGLLALAGLALARRRTR